jgi:hypothetical protein
LTAKYGQQGVTLTLKCGIIYHGFLEVGTTKSTSKLKRGEGVTFIYRNSSKREREINVLIKHAECIIEWSGRYELFTKHLDEIPYNGKIVNIASFRMNKIKLEAMPTILHEYIRRCIVKPSQLSWNAPAFFIK